MRILRRVKTLVPALSIILVACGGGGGDGGGGGGTTEPGVGSATVTVQDGSGSGLAGAEVSLTRSGEPSPPSQTTPASGSVTFSDLASGTWTLSVIPPVGFGHSSTSIQVSVPAGGVATQVVQAQALQSTNGAVEIGLTSSLRFDLATITISTGTTVRWVNQASIFHTVTPDGHSEWQEASMTQSGQTFEHTFDIAGTFDYFCQPHRGDGMTGIIRVQ